MSKPLVSIVIPTYNRIYELAELIESLSRQTLSDYEIIIVNDAGRPVEDIMRLYPKLNITIINLSKNQKHVHARNQGVTVARGEFIMLVDDDDLLMPIHLERMLEAIEDADLVYADAEIVNYKQEEFTRIPIDRHVFAYHYDLQAMRKFSTFIPSGCLYRKDLHRDIGLFDEEMANYWDWDFFLRVAERFRVKRVPIASVLYEFSAEGNNQSKNLAIMRKFLDRLSKKHHLGELPTKNFFLLLEEPAVKARKATTEIIWDGQPIISRLTHTKEAEVK